MIGAYVFSLFILAQSVSIQQSRLLIFRLVQTTIHFYSVFRPYYIYQVLK